MAIVTTDSKHYSNIAAAIREKTGDETTYTPEEIPAGIDEVYEAGKQEGIDCMVDKCLTVTESGSTVVFEPVEGYPLEVVSRIEPVQSGTGDPSPDNIRPISGYDKVKLTQSDQDGTIRPFEIDLGQTVYGGTLNWNTGVLTVDSAMYTFTGQETLHQFKDSVYNHEICENVQSSTGYSLVIGRSSHVPAISEGDSRLHVGMVVHSSINAGIQFNGLTTYWGLAEATVDAMKAYLAEQYAAGTPVQITYKLLNPITIQLTPQEIIALSGINTLCSDTGDTEVTGKIEPAAAYDTGFEEGTQSEYDRFWDIYQENGKRQKYEMAFTAFGWTDVTFKPKYDLILGDGYSGLRMFWSCQVTNIVEAFEKQGVKFDTTRCGHLEGMFQSTVTTRIPEMNCSHAMDHGYGLAYTFTNASAKSIDKLIVPENLTYPDTFNGCTNLENITFEGTIGNNISFANSPLLTTESVQSIIDHLKDLTGATTQTLTFHATVGAKLTDAQKATVTAKNWTLVY